MCGAAQGSTRTRACAGVFFFRAILFWIAEPPRARACACPHGAATTQFYCSEVRDDGKLDFGCPGAFGGVGGMPAQ